MAKKLTNRKFALMCHRQGLLLKGNTEEWDDLPGGKVNVNVENLWRDEI